MVDTSHAQARKLFIDALWELHRRAGSPSLVKLTWHSQNKLSIDTLSAYLSGEKTDLPAWRLVSAFLTASHATAKSAGLNRVRLGTIQDWEKFWRAATKGDYETLLLIGFPGHPTADHIQVPADALTRPVLQDLKQKILKRQKLLSAGDGLLIGTNRAWYARIYEVKNNVTTIGRDLSCDVWLNEPTVSRQHAKIVRHGDMFILHDLDSKNGIIRSGIRSREFALRSYDELKLGPVGLLFVQGGTGREKFKSQKYDPLRSHLIKDSFSNTSDMGAIGIIDP
jgi:pSer/pThr/pTyr-binding forkhead associated (FHA) protein